LERTTLIDSIVAEIQDKVISGELKEGEVLASQDELAKEMGVSRAPLREVQRASILLKYADGKTILSIKKELNVSRPTIYKCIDKALAAGLETGLKDKYHKPKEPLITEEAKAWVVNLACTKPKDHGYAAEMWTLAHLAKHTHTDACTYSWLSVSKTCCQGNDLSDS